MMNREPIIFKAHLLQGEEQVSIEAKYASQFSLSVRFLNGSKADQETVYRKLVFEKNFLLQRSNNIDSIFNFSSDTSR